jgi:hypothetical protein
MPKAKAKLSFVTNFDQPLTMVVEPVEDVDIARRAELECVINRGLQTFIEVGDALMEIRDQKLYRFGHDTFEAYCMDKWGWTRRRANQLIGAAAVAHNLEKMGTTVPKPTSERQMRPLVGLKEEQQRESWAEATTGDSNPTAQRVEEVIKGTQITSIPLLRGHYDENVKVIVDLPSGVGPMTRTSQSWTGPVKPVTPKVDTKAESPVDSETPKHSEVIKPELNEKILVKIEAIMEAAAIKIMELVPRKNKLFGMRAAMRNWKDLTDKYGKR